MLGVCRVIRGRITESILFKGRPDSAFWILTSVTHLRQFTRSLHTHYQLITSRLHASYACQGDRMAESRIHEFGGVWPYQRSKFKIQSHERGRRLIWARGHNGPPRPTADGTCVKRGVFTAFSQLHDRLPGPSTHDLKAGVHHLSLREAHGPAWSSPGPSLAKSTFGRPTRGALRSGRGTVSG